MPEALDPSHVTRLLELIQDGSAGAVDELVPLLYDELKQVAANCMDAQPADHTLQPTALVHEVWVRLANAPGGPRWESRAHFLHAAARTMRHVLVDHARAKQTAKRGGGRRQVPLDGLLASFSELSIDVLDLEQALVELGQMDAELARIVELRFFAGLTAAEVAEAQGVSERTVLRSWRVARLWLRDRMPDTELGADE